MKKISLIIISIIFLYSCKKDRVNNSAFTGIWEYESFSGYPFTSSGPLPPGNGKIIVLYANGNFERRQHDTVLFHGRYFLKKQKDCYSDENKIHFTTNDNGFAWDHYITINETGRLKLSTSNCLADGGVTTYHKIGD